MTMDLSTAPELPGDLRWLQTGGRFEWRTALRGHVVVLLCWRIGCQHSRAALHALAGLYRALGGRPFAVVAVHAPNREPERDPARVRAFLQLHALPCAVVLDPERAAWRELGATGWPFLMLVDPAGKVRFRGRGEPNAAALRGAVEGLLEEARAAGTLAARAFVPVIEPRPRAASGLCFPSRMCAADDGRVWLADTGHHRVLEIDGAALEVVRSFGNGEPGFADGGPDVARFCLPRGLCALADGVLAVDAGNHALRRIDRQPLNAATVCGDGERSGDRYGGGFGTMQGLCEPVDACGDGTSLRVAQSGANQLWTFDPKTQSAAVWLGTGAEDLRDGGEDACFSQPEGLWADREALLWVADAGNGALRTVELAHGAVRTRVQGLGRPAAVAGWRDDLLVADPWQQAVLRVNRSTAAVARLVGREHGLVAPEGLLLRGEELWIADAGSHRLLALDLAAPEPAATLRELTLRNVPPPHESPLYDSVDLAEAAVCAFADVGLWLRPPPAIAHRWPDGSMLALTMRNDTGALLTADVEAKARMTGDLVRIEGVGIGPPGNGTLRIDLRGPLAADGSTAPVSLRCRLPLVATGDGAMEARVG